MSNINDLLDSEVNKTEGSNPMTEHYYGDFVRRLFMFAAVVMIIGLPFMLGYIMIPVVVSLAGIVLLGVFAGLTNPRQGWVAVINIMISIGGSVIFETYAIRAFNEKLDFFFIVNQLLALTFLFALYYATKTMRGKLIK